MDPLGTAVAPHGLIGQGFGASQHAFLSLPNRVLTLLACTFSFQKQMDARALCTYLCHSVRGFTLLTARFSGSSYSCVCDCVLTANATRADGRLINGKHDDYVPDSAGLFITSAQGEGAIEGSIEDYAVAPQSDHFSTSFRFGRFDAATAPPRSV